MQTVLTTDEISSGNKFVQWCERLRESYFPIEGSRNGESRFEARLESLAARNIPMARLTQGPVQYKVCNSTVRKKNFRDDYLMVGLGVRGLVHTHQNDRGSIQGPGDIVIREMRSLTLSTIENSQEYHLSVPRRRIENLLGSAKLYTSLTLAAAQPATRLVNGFFAELIRVQDQLSPDTVARMSSIGIDLIVAGIADRLARELPKSLHGTLVVQRAKAFIEANIGDETLDPPQLSAAMGVSLRRLQELFQDEGRHISTWIWERRLDIAAERLGDSKSRHMQIANLAHGCGFSSQAHFSRRFKDRFGMTPREYREHAQWHKQA